MRERKVKKKINVLLIISACLLFIFGYLIMALHLISNEINNLYILNFIWGNETLSVEYERLFLIYDIVMYLIVFFSIAIFIFLLIIFILNNKRDE